MFLSLIVIFKSEKKTFGSPERVKNEVFNVDTRKTITWKLFAN